MRDKLNSFAGGIFDLWLRGRKVLVSGGIIFFAAIFFWETTLLKAALQVLDQTFPHHLALLPPLVAVIGTLICFTLGYLARNLKETIFLRSALVGGLLLDLASYETLGKLEPSLLIVLIAHVGLLVLCLSIFRIEFLQLAKILGLLALVLPWVAIPVCTQVSACGTQAAYPVLVVQGYKGYNIIQYNGSYYAILQSEGAFGMSKINSHAYSSCFFGPSVAAVEQLITANSTAPQSKC